MNNVVFLHNSCMKMLFLLSFCCTMLLCFCSTQPFVIWVWLLPNYCSYCIGFTMTKQSLLFFYFHNVGHNAFYVFAQDADATLV